MIEPTERLSSVSVKFPDEPTEQYAENVVIYPSGLMKVSYSATGPTAWYPPGEAPIIKE